MPSTLAELFAAAGVARTDVVRWRDPVGPPPSSSRVETGIYIVAFTDALDRVDGTLPKAPISRRELQTLLDRRPECRLDGAQPSAAQLQRRMAEFWFSDETVLYIGLAAKRSKRPTRGELANRVCEYYKTLIGAKSPHAGGFWLKALSCIKALYVHYAYCGDVDIAEGACIKWFADHVSPATRKTLRDSAHVMPFANLEYPPRTYKAHGITGARGPLPKSVLGSRGG
jgi:hypothetical protein